MTNKKYVLWIIVVLSIAAIVSCLAYFIIANQTKENLGLRIKETSWSGWSSDFESEEKEYQYDVELGKKYVVKTRTTSSETGNEEEDVLVFTITEVNPSSIKIKTTKSFSDKREGIDLSSDKTEFEITIGTDLHLTTPTMDAGNKFILSLVR